MTLTTVQECPNTEEAWQQRAKQCTRSDHFHCLLNENSVVVEGCINPIWVEPGNCPVYNSKANKLDAQKCLAVVCPKGVYRSNNLHKYNGCFTPKRTSDTPVSLNVNEAKQQNKTTLSIPSRPGTSSNVTAVVIPIILIIVILGVIAASAIVWNKRKRYRGNEKKTPQKQNEKKESLEQNEKLLCDIEDGFPQQSTCGNITDFPDKSGSFTREELLTHMDINIEEIVEEVSHVSQFATVLRENKTLALIGGWGSGKRTLAVQIALEMEKVANEKFQFKVILDFDEMCEPIISEISQPTVIILPDLYKFWHTDQHVEDIKKVLIFIRSIAKDKRLYTIASFTDNAWTSFTSFFPNKNVNSLFHERRGINLSSKTLSEIGGKKQLQLKETEINEILHVESVIGKPLLTTLYCKELVYRSAEFLKNPLMFMLSALRRMRDSHEVDNRMNFRVLEYTMLHGGNVQKEELENDTDHPLFEEMNTAKDKRDYIKACVIQLTNRYIEKTSSGNSYRMLHDVITKCVFLVAAEKEPELVFKECDFLLLLDCIRPKSTMEKIWQRSQYSFDYNALNVGIPTESFPMVARIFKERNEIMTMLRKVKLFSDEYFQHVWNNI